MIYQNHVVDPTYFYDAIEEFAFDFVIYVVTNKSIDEYGKRIRSFTKQMIRGSLQSDGTELNQSKDGSMTQRNYKFYCKSLYRIDIGDILEYKNNYLLVDSVHDYDEYGVREASLKQIQLTAYRDLADYIKYLSGEKFV